MDRDNLTPLLIDTNKAAKLLGVAPKTLANWRTNGIGPAYVRVAGPRSKVMYCPSDIEEWVDSRTRVCPAM